MADIKKKRKSTNLGIKPWVSWAVFLFSVSIVLLSLVSVIFPALILASNSQQIPGLSSAAPDPFEPGVWAVPLIVVDIIILGAMFLYFTGKLPRIISQKLESLFRFEISKKIAILSMTVLLIIYISASVQELSTEENWEDYKGVKKRLQTWSFDQIGSGFEPHVRYFLLSSSMMIFGNFRVIPFLASIVLLIVTYLITKDLTQKRFAGIISTIVLLQSNLFLTYDTTVAYTNFWILFYLLSLYFVIRYWPLSPIAYLLSILSKALTASFLPLSIFFILNSDIPRNKKLIIIAVTVIIIVAGATIALSDPNLDDTKPFQEREFWIGVTSFAYQLRFDGLILLFLLPLTIGLFIASKKGIRSADSIMILIAGMLIIAPLLTGMTNQTNQPYRFVPLIVFFAMGVGVLLSKRPSLEDE